MQDTKTCEQINNTPLISFIVTYHDEPIELLRECIASILALALCNGEREIILVDDGSSLSPMDFMPTKTAGAICYIHQPNRGLSAARNNGMAHAHGTYIQFVDADDELLPETYNCCITYLRDNHPDMLHFRSTTREDIHPKPNGFTTFQSGASYMKKHNLRPAAWGYLFKHQLAKGLTFPLGQLHEDEFFTPILTIRAESLCEMQAPAYYYRQRNNSITHNQDQQEHRMADFEKAMDYLTGEMGQIDNSERQQALQRRIHQMAMAATYNAMTLIDDKDKRELYIRHLTDIKRFPLPIKFYNTKYAVFSILSRTLIGRRLTEGIINLLPNKGKRM